MDLAGRLSKRLEGGKFRLLNDKMYRGKRLKSGDLKLYHESYAARVDKWPVNPLDVIIKKVQERDPGSVIADIGCGEAKIASLFKNVISLDLHPIKSDIIFCDMKQRIPLENKSIDIAVCCLSMMMENIAISTKEVNRILKIEGYWYVAEVRSRINGVNFLGKRFESFGFEVKHVDVSNSQFVLFVLKKKSEKVPKKFPKMELMPCPYRKR